MATFESEQGHAYTEEETRAELKRACADGLPADTTEREALISGIITGWKIKPGAATAFRDFSRTVLGEMAASR